MNHFIDNHPVIFTVIIVITSAIVYDLGMALIKKLKK
jgi:hypothetical protein